MKWCFLLLITFLPSLTSTRVWAQADESIEIINLASYQPQLFEQTEGWSAAKRRRLFLDSLYQSHSPLWDNYMGGRSGFKRWLAAVDPMSWSTEDVC